MMFRWSSKPIANRTKGSSVAHDEAAGDNASRSTLPCEAVLAPIPTGDNMSPSGTRRGAKTRSGRIRRLLKVGLAAILIVSTAALAIVGYRWWSAADRSQRRAIQAAID